MMGQTFYIQMNKRQFLWFPGVANFYNKGIFHIVVTFRVFDVIGFKIKMQVRIYFRQWG